jgi:hypothetical protein
LIRITCSQLILKQHFSTAIWMKKSTWKFLKVLRLAKKRN